MTLAPMELLTGQDGWCVVDPSSLLTRLWYFDGKFLRAEGFRRDQAYVRSLVALSNQAGGHGLVQGFTASKGTGDTIAVEPGLALTPSGLPILLTSRQDLPIATLVARASGGAEGAASGAFSPVPDFALCPPDAGTPPDAGPGSGPMWVLYARPIEALCGEEERFGQLCEDACATETDRSVVVEGVCFFVERLDLPLPTSSAVIFDGRHLRNRYASAYYAWERARTTSLISGAGLRSPIWCRGAEGVTGDAVALAVFDRLGEVTSFVDLWTARRELMETNPSRYWAWRMARRPRDVFLAQVLQFQCQLLDLPTTPGGGGDDCEDERQALSAANEVFASLAEAFEGAGREEGRAAEREAGRLIGADAYTRIAALRDHVSAVLSKGGVGATGSLLLDRAFAQLPPCGYLPVDPARSVQDQVRALMGPGVDLRFCAVRADYVGEAFEEAQHLERISLTQGIDDPSRLEEVDVLVPDGTISSAPVKRSPAFEGRLRLRPQLRVEDGRSTTGAALGLAMVGREQLGESWSWTLAGAGESPGNVAVAPLLAAVLVDAGIDEEKVAAAGAPVGEGVEVPFVADERMDAAMADPGFVQRVSREGYYAKARRARAGAAAAEEVVDIGAAVGPDRKIAPDEARPLAVWFDLEVDRPLTSLPRGGSSPASLRMTMYSRAKQQPVLVDMRVTGTLTVDDVVTGTGGGGVSSAVTITTTLRGATDPMIVIGTHTVDQPPSSFTDLELVWQVGRASSGAKVALVAIGRPAGQAARVQPTIAARDEGTPRHVEAVAALVLAGASKLTTHAAVIGPIGEGVQSYELARLELDELAGGFEGSPSAKAIGESAIEMIGAELSLPGRDPSFTPTARRRLFQPDEAEAVDQVVGTADWVFFHRRRERRCEGRVIAPVGVRRYRLYHAVLDDATDLKRFAGLGGIHARTADELPGFEAADLAGAVRERSDLDYVQAYVPVSGLGFRPVATLEFEAGTSSMLTPTSVLRTAWQSGDRGSRLVLAAAGDIGVGDGEDVVLGRLSTVRSAIADLIDQQGVRVRHLATIPPEFQETGLDGALFTVGFHREEPEVRGCITLVRLGREAVEVLQKVFGEDDIAEGVTLDEILGVLAEHGIAVDTFTATFDEDRRLLDEEAVRRWWGPIPPAFATHLVARERVDAGEEELWRARSRVTAEAVGLGSRINEAVIASAGDCGAALLLMTTGGVDRIVSFVRR